MMMMCGTSEDLLNVAYPNMVTRRKRRVYLYRKNEMKKRQGAGEFKVYEIEMPCTSYQCVDDVLTTNGST